MFLTRAYLEFELMEEKVQHGKQRVSSHAGLKNAAILDAGLANSRPC